MLEATGVWPALAQKAQPVLRIELTDSALEAPVRPSLIGLDSRETPGGEATAYIVENADLLAALLASLEGAPGIEFFTPDRVTAFEARPVSFHRNETRSPELLALDVEDLNLEQVRWIVLMVLSSQPGQEQACARMETLVFDPDTSAAH